MNSLYGERYEAFSAGTEPSEVNQYAIEVMSEIGIDISGHRSKGLEEFLSKEFDYGITVCDHANEVCPIFPGGKERIHRAFIDPAAVEGDMEEKIQAFRKTRDEILKWIRESFKK